MPNWIEQLRNRIGNPDADTLTSIVAKIGNIPATLDALLRTGYSSSAVTRNVDGSVLERLEAILQKTPLLMPYLVELWQDEAGIDASLWTNTSSGTGSFARSISGAYARVLLNLPAAGGGDTASLTSVQRWVANAGGYGGNTIGRRLVAEAQIALLNSPNRFVNISTIIFGLCSGAASSRSSVNQISFVLDADDLASLTDSAGAETLNAINGLTLTNYNLYRIEVSSGTVKFYVNGVLEQTHVANIPDAPMFLRTYGENDAGGADGISIAGVRAWIDDEPYA